MSSFKEMEIRSTVALDSGDYGTRRACNNENCLKDYGHNGLCTTAEPTLLVTSNMYRCPCCQMPLIGTPEGHLPDCVVRKCTEENLKNDGWISPYEDNQSAIDVLRKAVEQAKKSLNAGGHKTSCAFTGCTCGAVDTFKSERLEFFRLVNKLKKENNA